MISGRRHRTHFCSSANRPSVSLGSGFLHKGGWYKPRKPYQLSSWLLRKQVAAVAQIQAWGGGGFQTCRDETINQRRIFHPIKLPLFAFKCMLMSQCSPRPRLFPMLSVIEYQGQGYLRYQ